MKTILNIIFSFSVITAFGQADIVEKNISIKFNSYDGNKDVRVRLQFKVPNNYSRIIKNGPGMDGEVDWQILYPDSSIIYISNEFLRFYYLNQENLLNEGYKNYTYNSTNDTIVNSGFNSKSKYWKDIACTGFVRGYINVNPDMKPVYDKSIKVVKIRIK